MRYGALISAVCHIGLVSFVMLSTPRQFVASERSIEAELVRADEIDLPKEQPQEQPKEQPKPEKPSVWDFPEERLRIELPKFSPDARPNSSGGLPMMNEPGVTRIRRPPFELVNSDLIRNLVELNNR